MQKTFYLAADEVWLSFLKIKNDLYDVNHIIRLYHRTAVIGWDIESTETDTSAVSLIN